MKRIVVAFTFAAALGASAQAAARDTDEEIRYPQQWRGLGIGALIGALAGGPPGLILGAAGGGWLGHHQGIREDLEEARRRIAELTALEDGMTAAQREIAALRQGLSRDRGAREALEKALEAAKKQHRARLDAIARGFVLNIQFRTESAELEPRFDRQLEQGIALLRAFPELVIQVDGHADRRGTDAFNQALTRRRVHALTQRLRAAGIPAGRIRERPLGESGAAYPPEDAEGLAFDRRVLLYLRRDQGD